MSNEDDFYVGYGAMPKKDRRFLLKAVPAGLLGLAGAGAFIGTRAASQGGGRWETGTPVTLTGRIGFNPYPVLWVDGVGHVIAGIGKINADPYIKPFEGQAVQVRGVKIVRNDCFMLGVAQGDIKASSENVAGIPQTEILKEVSLMGEILDAQCFMGIMNPGYGRTHRGCATLCIRGGQPVFFSLGLNSAATGGGAAGCAGIGHLLANEAGEKINDDILNHILVPLTLTARHERIGNLSRLIYQNGSLKRL